MKPMTDTRFGRAKLNIVTSLAGQFVTLICGIIVPRLLLRAFGSEAYGATASIAQFLAYITLLEGGIGGVARAALYKPLANGDIQTISGIVCELKRFFRKVAGIFTVYVLVLALSFKKISGFQTLDWAESFILVIVISLSTFAEYFIGISYAVLIQAAQKNYITIMINIATKIMNTVFIVVLISLNSSLITVKLVSSCIFVIKPVLLWLYVKKNYRLAEVNNPNVVYLKDKWVGFAQHIAYFLHSNTDIAVLTIMGNLKMVAVYSVYYMVVSQIQNVCSSFINGMEALFGDMLAKEEMTRLSQTFNYYEALIALISTIAFSVTTVMILPFVRIYTSVVSDVNYIEPAFSVVLILASYIYCLRTPYHGLVIAAGHFRQTQIAAYGEAAINILLSIILVKPLGLLGVAIGTIAATSFRLIYYVFYLRKTILHRSILLFLKREAVNGLSFISICLIGNKICMCFGISSYVSWAGIALIISLLAVMITLVGNLLFFHNESVALFRRFARRRTN